MTNPDACIWQSAWNIWQAQENLNKLFEALDLIECQQQNLVIECEDSDECEGEFIQPVWNAYYSVKRSMRRNARVEGWITLAIQLTCKEGNEADWEFGKRAKVLVGYCPLRSFDDAWGFDVDSPNSSGYSEDAVATATHWTLEEGDGRTSWFYALPLDQMTDTARIRQYIVEPLQTILTGEDGLEQVLNEIRGVLCIPPQPNAES
ncbi:MAG: hypothetical protein GW767_05140 [Rhodobacterales bacterium]|nr:hypothetical protein [Rhodobacterales bacterium]